MSVLHVTIGETAPISLVLEDGASDQYPRARIYQQGSPTVIAQLPLDHVSEGLYNSIFLPPSVGAYNVVYTVFDDAGYTIPNSNYTKELDQILVEPESGVADLATQLQRVLGLLHENAFIDDTLYDDCGQVISSRVRIFDSAAAASAATDGGNETAGLVATYQVTVDYEGAARMKTYRMLRV